MFKNNCTFGYFCLSLNIEHISEHSKFRMKLYAKFT